MTGKYLIGSAEEHVLVGCLGDDPVAWATKSGLSMTVFSVKVVRQMKVKAGDKVETKYFNTWFRVKTFGAIADACLQFLHQDRLVYVQGTEMQAWGFIDPKTGEPRGALELKATNVIFLDQPNVGLAGSNALPLGDIDFSRVSEVDAVAIEVEELALAG